MEKGPQNSRGNKAPEIKEVAKEWNLAQIQLAVLAAKEAHPDLPEREVRRVAMQEWIDLLAGRFNEYMEDPVHEHETCDLSDPIAVKELLEKIRNYKQTPETLH